MYPLKYSVFLLLILKVLKSSCESSLTFVIDDTSSMENVINQVKRQVDRILNVTLEEKSTEIKDFVLVAFNHDVLTFVNKTSDRATFKSYVNSIFVHTYATHACPEMSMGGTKRGLEESGIGSYLYVFTDSAADDYKEYEQVIELCQRKQIQVMVFIVENYCTHSGGENFEVYYKIAAACSGQVFIINKDDMTMAIDVIRAKIRGKHSLLASRVIPPYKKVEIEFYIDEKVLSTLITMAGDNVDYQVTLPNKVGSKKLMSSANSKAVELTNLVSGKYSVTVSGHSTSSVVITGRTNFAFVPGFSLFPPSKANDTITQPIAGQSNFLSVTVTDPGNEVAIKTAHILDMNENVKIEIPLRKVHKSFYATDMFSTPDYMFNIAVKGILKSNGHPVRRISKTPVQPKILIRPSIDTSHKKIETTDARTVTIPCKILTGVPRPTVSWYYKTMSSSSYQRFPGNEEEITIDINKSTVSRIFKCVVENEAGRDEHITELVVTSKPKIIIDKGSKIPLKYGSTITVTCHVTANPAAIVEWRDDKNVAMQAHTREYQNKTGDMHFEHISDIVLNNVKVSRKYSCYASNTRGITNEAIDVQVSSPFQSSAKAETMNLGYGKSYVIPCKVESELPVIVQWFFTPEKSSKTETLKSSDKYYLSSNGSSLIINYMDLDLRGKYTCSVTLISDKNENQSYDVNLKINDLMAPQLMKSIKPLIVKEKVPATISCNILKGVPKPTITWYFKSKEMDMFRSLSSVEDKLHLKSVILNNAGIYKCVAKNALDHDEVTIELVVQVPPVIDKSKKVIETTDAKTLKIPCKILAAKPEPNISWYFKTASSLSYKILPDKSDELIVNINESSLSGKFKCVAVNEAGQDEHITELVVTLKPKIIIDKGSKISVKYGSTILLTCYVTAKPKATVEWRDSNNVVMPAHTQHYQNNTGNSYFEYVSNLELKNVRLSKKYSCYSSNSRGATIDAIDVTVLSPFQRQGLREETMNLGYGKSFVIPCKVVSELPILVKWFFTPEKSSKTETLKSSDKYYLSSNGSSLIINYMDLDLRGKYTCSVTLISDKNENQSYDVNLKINDLMAPQLMKSIKPLIVKEKMPATISCNILKGVPKPTITWHFKSNEMDTFQTISSVGGIIHFKHAMLVDAGTYKCTALNAIGNDEMATQLIIEAPPRINNNVKIFKGVIGDVVLRIPCNVTGFPKPNISWSDREGGKAFEKDQKYSIEDGVLIIKNPVIADTKEYWCTAKNIFNSVTQSFSAIVTEDIDYENVHEVYILQGETKKINCLLPHTATDSIRWYLNGNLMNVTGSYVHFVNATVFMDGNYTCRVSNNLESKSDTILVDVGYIPEFTILMDTKITNWKGEGDLNCEVSAKPTATAEWFHSGEPLESARDNFQLDIFDWGEYSCRIKNVHGTVERTFSVSSGDCLLNRDVESLTTTPVILSKSSTWPDYKITNQYVNFDSGEKLRLLCPNTTKGFRKFPEKNEIDVTCDNENKFLFDGKIYKYSDFHCNRPVMPVIQKMGDRCLAENSETIHVGFPGKTFSTAYEVCMDTRENLPLYTHMTLTTARYQANVSELKWFKYTKIESRMQDNVFTCSDNVTSCCYTKGQLVNATDVTFGPMQTSTYVDYLNTVPIWLPCTERTTWSEIEDVIRTQVITQETFSIWSGASAYTERNGGKIPRFLWKVVKGSEDFIIAVVYVNEDTPKEEDIFCENICDGDTMLWLTPKDKFTYCCKLEDFVHAFNLRKNLFV